MGPSSEGSSVVPAGLSVQVGGGRAEQGRVHLLRCVLGPNLLLHVSLPRQGRPGPVLLAHVVYHDPGGAVGAGVGLRVGPPHFLHHARAGARGEGATAAALQCVSDRLICGKQ